MVPSAHARVTPTHAPTRMHAQALSTRRGACTRAQQARAQAPMAGSRGGEEGGRTFQDVVATVLFHKVERMPVLERLDAFRNLGGVDAIAEDLRGRGRRRRDEAGVRSAEMRTASSITQRRASLSRELPHAHCPPSLPQRALVITASPARGGRLPGKRGCRRQPRALGPNPGACLRARARPNGPHAERRQRAAAQRQAQQAKPPCCPAPWVPRAPICSPLVLPPRSLKEPSSTNS